MWSGKKETARKVVYSAFDLIKEKTKQEPLEAAFKSAGGSLKTMLKNLEVCLSSSPKDEQDLWQKVESCQKPVSLDEYTERTKEQLQLK